MTATAARGPSSTAQPAPAAIAVVPVLATVYQTIVLTDVTGDVIRKGIEGDSYQMLWTNLPWGVSTLYGVFLGLWAMARIGARWAIAIGLVILALGNGLCGASVDVPSLAASRLVEGIGKGMTIGLSRSALYRQFDRSILVAIGIYGVIAYSTRPLTPAATAYVNDLLSWRWIYWIDVPIALLGLVLVLKTFRPDRPPRPLPLRLDWVAVALMAAWVSCMLFAFGWYRRRGGWTSDAFTVTDDYRQGGAAGPELSGMTSTALGGFARAESVARGFQDGLRFLSLAMLGIGLPLAAFRFVTPPGQRLIADPFPRSRVG